MIYMCIFVIKKNSKPVIKEKEGQIRFKRVITYDIYIENIFLVSDWKIVGEIRGKEYVT